MTWLITTFYQTEVEKQMSSTESRTVAFQVPADLFEQFKVYLDRHHVKQKAFFLDCIQRALADEAERPHEVSTDVDEERRESYKRRVVKTTDGAVGDIPGGAAF